MLIFNKTEADNYSLFFGLFGTYVLDMLDFTIVYVSVVLLHMQYTEIFKVVKNENFQ